MHSESGEAKPARAPRAEPRGRAVKQQICSKHTPLDNAKPHNARPPEPKNARKETARTITFTVLVGILVQNLGNFDRHVSVCHTVGQAVSFEDGPALSQKR